MKLVKFSMQLTLSQLLFCIHIPEGSHTLHLMLGDLNSHWHIQSTIGECVK